MKTSSSEAVFVIQDRDTLKVIADPLRWQIMELLVLEPLTVKELGEKLGLSPSKLYYHVNTLEDHGLVKVAETRIVSGIIEKHYQAVSSKLDINPELLSFTELSGRENINTILLSTIDATRDDLLRSLQARAFEIDHGMPQRPRHVLINRVLSRIPDEHALEFKDRLTSLIKEFSAADQEGDAQPFALTVAYYPAFYYRELDLDQKSGEVEKHG